MIEEKADKLIIQNEENYTNKVIIVVLNEKFDK